MLSFRSVLVAVFFSMVGQASFVVADAEKEPLIAYLPF